MKIISSYNNFANSGGAQDIAVLLARHFCSESEKPVILTSTKQDDINEKYVSQATFLKFSRKTLSCLTKKYSDIIILSHDRKTTSKLMIYNYFLKKKIIVIHVAHNYFDNLRLFTLLPENIVAISSAVFQNLTDYFKIDQSRISLIPNGVEDRGVRPTRKSDNIRLLLAGRICKVKRQLEIAMALDGHLPAHINIDFAGRGEDELALSQFLAGNKSMSYIGQIDVERNIADYDYMLLCSQREGLPLSLIESCMYGRPMITNNFPSVLDVNTDGQTGYVCRDDKHLIEILQHLALPGSPEYMAMAHNARKHYEQRFKLPTMLEAYDNLIQKVANSHNEQAS